MAQTPTSAVLLATPLKARFQALRCVEMEDKKARQLAWSAPVGCEPGRTKANTSICSLCSPIAAAAELPRTPRAQAQRARVNAALRAAEQPSQRHAATQQLAGPRHTGAVPTASRQQRGQHSSRRDVSPPAPRSAHNCRDAQHAMGRGRLDTARSGNSAPSNPSLNSTPSGVPASPGWRYAVHRRQPGLAATPPGSS
jgi:hypothetical protein